MQPDSSKSDTQKTKDKASGGMDSALGSMQPDSMKSDSQKAGDKGQSMFQQAKDTVSDTFSGDKSKFWSGMSLPCRESKNADCDNCRQAVSLKLSGHTGPVDSSR
jgi:hypothetical protein